MQSPKGTKENRKENLRAYLKSRKVKPVKKIDLRFDTDIALHIESKNIVC